MYFAYLRLLEYTAVMLPVADDFGGVSGTQVNIGRYTASRAEVGEKRKWLKVYETLPPQMLNAYGEAKFAKTSDAEVWIHF